MWSLPDRPKNSLTAVFFTAALVFIGLVVLLGANRISVWWSYKRYGHDLDQTVEQQYFKMSKDYELVSLSIPKTSEELSCFSDQSVEIHYAVENKSSFVISSSLFPRRQNQGVNISYRIFDRGFKNLLQEGKRFFLLPSLLPVEFVNRKVISPGMVRVECNLPVGTYDVVLSLVQEQVAWQYELLDKNKWAAFILTIKDKNSQ